MNKKEPENLGEALDELNRAWEALCDAVWDARYPLMVYILFWEFALLTVLILSE